MWSEDLVASAARQSTNAFRHSVLLVDTDLGVLRDFADALRGDGYDVLPATSFQEGKRLWMHHRPGVLVVDVRLGEFNGLQLLMRARTDRPDLHAIITCHFADCVLEAEARRFGGDFLVKPIAPMQIVAAIGRAKAPQRSKGADVSLWIERGKQRASADERRLGNRRQVIAMRFLPERRYKDRRGV